MIGAAQLQYELSVGLHKTQRGAQSKAILLICCCHIVCTVFCDFSVCHRPACILCQWPVNGLPEASDCPQPRFACLLFVHHSSFVGWSASQWVARQDSWHLSAKMKGGFRDGYWTLHGREVSCYSPIQSPLPAQQLPFIYVCFLKDVSEKSKCFKK